MNIQNKFLYIILIIIGLLGQIFSVNLFFGVDVIFGSIIVMLILLRSGTLSGVAAAIIIHSYTYFLWNHPFAWIIFTLEALTVGLLLKYHGKKQQTHYIIVYDLLFWLILGIPLTTLLYGQVMGLNTQIVILILLKQIINGVFNTLWASLLFAYTPLGRKNILLPEYKTVPFQQTIHNLLATAVLTVALILMTYNTRIGVEELKQNLIHQLKNTAQQIEYSIQTWLTRDLYAVKSLADHAARLDFSQFEQLQQLTNALRDSNPDFLRAYLADETATVINTAPFYNDQGESWIGENFADRPYFPKLKQSLKPVISNVFMGRIGTPHPILTIGVPIIKNGQFSGYAQIGLNLEKFSHSLVKITKKLDLMLTLLDSRNRIIASLDETQAPLHPFQRHQQGEIQPLEKNTYLWLAPLQPGQSALARWGNSFYVHRLTLPAPLNWELIVEAQLKPYQLSLYSLYIKNLTVMLIIVLLTIWLAILVSRHIVSSLEKLSVITTKLATQMQNPQEIDWPCSRITEVNLLIDDFNLMAISLQEQFKKLEEASTAKSQFVANMSHELRTPMNAIIGYSEILQEDILESEDAQMFLPDIEKIHAAGKHLLSIINDILDISKIEAGKMEIHSETFHLGKLIQEVEVTVLPLIQQKNNQLKVAHDEEIGEIYADLTKIRQMLFNLLSNASKFTERGTITLITQLETIQVDNEAEELWIRICVFDQGIGMTEAQLQKLFNPFSQADASTTRKYGGTGLGLAITKRFAEMMGGDIKVDSKYGQGSVFSIRLPKNLPAAPPPLPPAPIGEGLLEKSNNDNLVLVIDDDAVMRELLYHHLEKLGYRVITATSGQEGLELAKELKPHAITLDVMMPDLDGWTVLTQLKAQPELSSTPVIIASMVEDRNAGYALGAAEYLTKPINRNLLRDILNRYHPQEKGNQLVMVVDDDVVNREMMANLLTQTGWTVIQAENGRLALELLQRQTPNLILLDLLMPEMNGFELINKLRENPSWWSIPVVILTSKELTETENQQLNSYVDKIFQKHTLQQKDLLTEIERQLRTLQTNTNPQSPASD